MTRIPDSAFEWGPALSDPNDPRCPEGLREALVLRDTSDERPDDN